MTLPQDAPPAARVARTIAAARRRLALRSALVVAAGAALLAVVLVELAWTLGLLPAGGLLLPALSCAAVGVVALAATLRRAAPSPALTAAVLDELLGRGATLSTAVEAVAGGHPRFAGALLDEAERALSRLELRRALPLRAPAGLLLGAATAALLPALLPAALAAPAPRAPTTGRPALVALLGGGAGGPDAGQELPPGEVVAVTQGPAAPPDAAALPALSPEAAALLREQLEPLLAHTSTPGRAGSTPPSPTSSLDAIDEALRRGDLGAAREALERLAEAAGRGDRAAAARLDRLADDLAGPAGAGSAPAGSTTPAPAGSASAPGPASPTGEGATRARRPWALEAATRRYFDASSARGPRTDRHQDPDRTDGGRNQ